MGVGPLLAWRYTSGRSLTRALAAPTVVGALVGAALLLLGVEQGLAAVAGGACAFAALAVGVEYWRGVRARQRGGQGALAALGTLVARNRRRYGGYVVHLAMLLIAVGVLGTGHQIERTLSWAG